MIASEAVRAVLEQLGLHDVMTKVIGSKNTINVVRATIEALSELEIPLLVARRRKISLDQLFSREIRDVRDGHEMQKNLPDHLLPVAEQATNPESKTSETSETSETSSTSENPR